MDVHWLMNYNETRRRVLKWAMLMDNALVTGCEMRVHHLLRCEARVVGTPRCFDKAKGVGFAVHDSDLMASKIAVFFVHEIGRGGGGTLFFLRHIFPKRFASLRLMDQGTEYPLPMNSQCVHITMPHLSDTYLTHLNSRVPFCCAIQLVVL